MKKSRGFTLIELMITIVIMSIIIAIAVPSMSSFVIKQRIQSQVDELMLALVYARTEALKHNNVVYVIPNGSTAEDWQNNGWCVVLKNSTGVNESCSSASNNILKIFESKKNIKTVTSYTTQGALRLNFTAQGTLGVAANMFKIYSSELSDAQRDAALRCIFINKQGRARVEKYTPGAEGQCKI